MRRAFFFFGEGPSCVLRVLVPCDLVVFNESTRDLKTCYDDLFEDSS